MQGYFGAASLIWFKTDLLIASNSVSVMCSIRVNTFSLNYVVTCFRIKYRDFHARFILARLHYLESSEFTAVQLQYHIELQIWCDFLRATPCNANHTGVAPLRDVSPWFNFLNMFIQCRVRVFEYRILRQIFGPKRDENGEWRRLHNEELHILYRSPNMVRVIV